MRCGTVVGVTMVCLQLHTCGKSRDISLYSCFPRRTSFLFVRRSNIYVQTYTYVHTHIRYIHIHTMKLQHHKESENALWHCCWSNNGSFVATCGKSRELSLYSCSNKDELKLIDVVGSDVHDRTVRSLTFDPVRIIFFFSNEHDSLPRYESNTRTLCRFPWKRISLDENAFRSFSSDSFPRKA